MWHHSERGDNEIDNSNSKGVCNPDDDDSKKRLQTLITVGRGETATLIIVKEGGDSDVEVGEILAAGSASSRLRAIASDGEGPEL